MKYARLSSALIVVILLATLVGVNFTAAKYHHRWDLTKSKRFTLSQKTREILANLKEPVKITAFIAEGSSTGSDIKNLLKEYGFASSKINVNFYDPEKDPSIAKKYNIQEYNTIVVEDSKHQRTISQYNLYSPGKNPYSMDFNGEQAVTRAILDLNRQNKANIYFLKGHGEASLISDLDSFNSYLKGEGYITHQLELSLEGKIPDDASLVVAAGPQRDLVSKEREMLESYVSKGGKLLIFLGPADPSVPLIEWKNLLSFLGLEAHDDIVTDPQRSFYSDPLTPVPMVENHEVTQSLLNKKLTVIFPYSRSLEPLKKLPDALQVRSLLITSNDAFGETDLSKNKVMKDNNDIQGPLHLAYAISRPAETKKQETPLDPNTITAPDMEIGDPIAVVAGNIAFLGPQTLGLAGNLDFAAGSVTWLLQSTNLLSIPAKSEEPPFVNLTGSMVQAIFYSTVVGLPLIIIIAGFVVWLRRRNL
ncbi:ABC transporter [Biomaibacter acetigenes]|uniref:ABC transporter n=1 Tax=Biomaibacter acetigenes TaxID=2316383 RepID=A0A3G2R689_9FIRM|nr:GldG family protein [Biomaibacter acetigenes]AYO30903.1 ABC transporter [Biomaibacter acetigenes]